MDIVKIIRKGRPKFVRLMSVSELDKSKCSSKFLSHNLNDDVIVNVKCFEDGTLDLRGKKEEYRIIVEDSQTKINLNKMGNIEKIDLSICKKGDILISSHGTKLEYICPTPWKHFIYLDHVVRYIEDKDGNPMGDECYGTRTNDGFVFLKKRIPETDDDIVKIIQK